MSDPLNILAIDAAINMGWAFGETGKPPMSGSFKCAGKEASRGAVFAGCGRWLKAFLSDNHVDLLAIEAPLPGSHVAGKTNAGTATILMGLPAVLEYEAFLHRVYAQERVLISSVRKHFIGKGNMPGDVAKPLVWRKCLALGWISVDDEDLSHDRSDACAVWSYAQTIHAPKLAQPVDDLFVKAESRRREAAEKARLSGKLASGELF